MRGSSNIIICKISSAPLSLHIPFLFNIVGVEKYLTNLKLEVKAIRSPREAIIWFFLFRVIGTRENFEGLSLGPAQWIRNLVYGVLSTSQGG